MSKFSEFLESCVHNISYNITQLAKLSGVNRTHLQKILIGERFLNNEELFDRLLSNLHLSWEKEQELRRLYRIEQIGEKRYEQMLNVIEFFKVFKNQHKSLLLLRIPLSALTHKVLFLSRDEIPFYIICKML